MSSNPRRLVVTACTLLLFAGAASGGDTSFQGAFGVSFFSSSPPCKAKDLPTFEVIAPVPALVDPFEDDIIPVFCQISAWRKGNNTNIRGSYESDLVVRDNNTGQLETFDLDSGKFRTGPDGIDRLEFEIPAPIFADGFESGDVSAWSYTRVDPKRGQKADNVSVECNVGSSTSSSN